MNTNRYSRRSFAALTAGAFLTSTVVRAEDKPAAAAPEVPLGPREAPFERDYEAPKFQPKWKNAQLNRTLIQDFVMFAHTDLEMVKKLVEKEAALVLAIMNWGAGDWESGLGAAAHCGRHDIVELLLEKGARPDIFCSAMLGQVDVVRTLITFQPKLIDVKGPHGFSLHFHAQVGGEQSANVLDYLQTVKKIELKPNPFLKMKEDAKKQAEEGAKPAPEEKK
ncbi:ankyrin repeat domain-containing protein [Anatilimnocola floriformis]|uniref:ankyrin repeat domain-containing protein n=1 Tax=Anatilimnocola floriformis TaxID=2948575 RepID=UPI0020C43B9E|nr:ankyrin repeat domain-containing protein [Anatilimnocola floriformis]